MNVMLVSFYPTCPPTYQPNFYLSLLLIIIIIVLIVFEYSICIIIIIIIIIVYHVHKNRTITNLVIIYHLDLEVLLHHIGIIIIFIR